MKTLRYDNPFTKSSPLFVRILSDEKKSESNLSDKGYTASNSYNLTKNQIQKKSILKDPGKKNQRKNIFSKKKISFDGNSIIQCESIDLDESEKFSSLILSPKRLTQKKNSVFYYQVAQNNFNHQGDSDDSIDNNQKNQKNDKLIYHRQKQNIKTKSKNNKQLSHTSTNLTQREQIISIQLQKNQSYQKNIKNNQHLQRSNVSLQISQSILLGSSIYFQNNDKTQRKKYLNNNIKITNVNQNDEQKKFYKIKEKNKFTQNFQNQSIELKKSNFIQEKKQNSNISDNRIGQNGQIKNNSGIRYLSQSSTNASLISQYNNFNKYKAKSYNQQHNEKLILNQIKQNEQIYLIVQTLPQENNKKQLSNLALNHISSTSNNKIKQTEQNKKIFKSDRKVFKNNENKFKIQIPRLKKNTLLSSIDSIKQHYTKKINKINEQQTQIRTFIDNQFTDKINCYRFFNRIQYKLRKYYPSQSYNLLKSIIKKKCYLLLKLNQQIKQIKNEEVDKQYQEMIIISKDIVKEYINKQKQQSYWEKEYRQFNERNQINTINGNFKQQIIQFIKMILPILQNHLSQINKASKSFVKILHEQIKLLKYLFQQLLCLYLSQSPSNFYQKLHLIIQQNNWNDPIPLNCLQKNYQKLKKDFYQKLF